MVLLYTLCFRIQQYRYAYTVVAGRHCHRLAEQYRIALRYGKIKLFAIALCAHWIFFTCNGKSIA